MLSSRIELRESNLPVQNKGKGKRETQIKVHEQTQMDCLNRYLTTNKIKNLI